MGTPFQHKWITKLIGYDFTVEYKKGVDNRVVDELSRMEELDFEVTVSLFIIFDYYVRR